MNGTDVPFCLLLPVYKSTTIHSYAGSCCESRYPIHDKDGCHVCTPEMLVMGFFSSASATRGLGRGTESAHIKHVLTMLSMHTHDA